MGPGLQWALERGPSADPIELRVYEGDDASFVLYEDDGVTTAYATSNQSSTIELSWADASRRLTIGERAGRGFKGMLTRRTFRVVLVQPGHGVGPEPTREPNVIVAYNGSSALVVL